MKKSTVVTLCLFSFAIGMLIWAIQNEWIVIRFAQPVVAIFSSKSKKKKIDHYYWQNTRWHKESQELLWNAHSATDLATLTASWLDLVDAERIINKKVTLQSAMIAPNGHDALLSFDRSPFAKSWSIEQKLMFIEGLIKTIRESGIALRTIQFLIDHQPMHDTHLDFSSPWPISGFA